MDFPGPPLWLNQPIQDIGPGRVKNLFNGLLNTSSTKYPLENVLYSKWMGDDILSPNIKTVAVVFFRSWLIKQQKCCIWNCWKNTQLETCCANPRWRLKIETWLFLQLLHSDKARICKIRKKAILCDFEECLNFPSAWDCLLCGVPYISSQFKFFLLKCNN